MQFNTYTSAGAHIAAALVNDPMTDVAAVGVLLAGFDVEEPVPGEAELAELRDWTARLPWHCFVRRFLIASTITCSSASSMRRAGIRSRCSSCRAD